MCGFAAFIEQNREFGKALLRGADSDLYHRGPDGGGVMKERGWALVFRRLTILDVSEAANQPMTDTDGQLTLVFNGEIYNYRHLRKELESKGVRFRTSGDTEVLLEGYRQWKEALLDRLEGMYAFVIVDRSRNQIVAARDPLGIKPLYMRKINQTIGFASEMRPLLRLGPVTPDPLALAELLDFNWAAGNLSNVKEIEEVEPGTLITVSMTDNKISRRRFFDILDTLEPKEGSSKEQALETIEEVLEKSLIDHLASDVGYTVQLSGGVDSSLMTAFAEAHSEGPLASFGVDLGDYEHNERRWREMVVQGRNIDHHEIPLGGAEFAEALPRAVRHMEGPVPHGGDVMLMLLCRHAREHSRVIITGEGADEMFGGYERYSRWRKRALRERIGRHIPKILMPNIYPFKTVRKLSGKDAVVLGTMYRDPAWLHFLFPDLERHPGAREAASRRFDDYRDRMFAVDQTVYLQSLLVRQDKMSMAESVEARVPFVHMPVLRAVNALPRDLRAPGERAKPLLKDIASRHLPRDLVERRKVGLLLPYDDWCRDPKALGRYVEGLTDTDSQLIKFADHKRFVGAIDEYRNGNHTTPVNIFKLINLELWLRELNEQQKARNSTYC